MKEITRADSVHMFNITNFVETVHSTECYLIVLLNGSINPNLTTKSTRYIYVVKVAFCMEVFEWRDVKS